MPRSVPTGGSGVQLGGVLFLRAERDAAFAAGVEAAAHWIETVPETLPNRQEIARAIRALTTKGEAKS
jgi:hypothetical protein